MMHHHAYFYAGDRDKGVEAARTFGEETLGLSGAGNQDLLVLTFDLLSVEDARDIGELATRTSLHGKHRLIVIAASRLFHESQNALLKTFEEPPEGTHLILIVPSEGNIIPTLRSRLVPLIKDEGEVSSQAKEFLEADDDEREKIVERLLNKAKSDAPEDKQAARIGALQLAEGLCRASYTKKEDPEHKAFLEDLSRLIPILHERSAPLKPILEHLLIVAPKEF